MSTIAVPKPAAGRPPIFPPITTTYDGNPSEEPEANLQRLIDDVNKLLLAAHYTPDDGLDVLLKLLEQRRNWVSLDLFMERTFSEVSLPPMEGLEMSDIFEPRSKDERKLLWLLEDLESAILRVRKKLAVINMLPPASDS